MECQCGFKYSGKGREERAWVLTMYLLLPLLFTVIATAVSAAAAVVVVAVAGVHCLVSALPLYGCCSDCIHIERLLFDLEWLSYVVYSEAQLWQISLAEYQAMDAYGRFKLIVNHCDNASEFADILQDSALPFVRAWATSPWYASRVGS